MNKYLDMSHGMELYPDEVPNQRQNENGIHFLTIYYILRYLNGKLTAEDLNIYEQIVYNITSFNDNGGKILGLYDRGSNESLQPNKDSIRTISHDNINSIACFSTYFSLQYHKDIYKYGHKHSWRFDNVYPKNPRISRTMHPRDIIFWSFLCGKFWAKLFLWEPLLECLLTCLKVYDIKPRLHERIWYKLTRKQYIPYQIIATSGKLLAFVRLFTIKKTWYGKLTWKICNYFINKNFEYGWKTIFTYYFKDPENPIRKELEELYSKNKELM